jgi:hypothetical protein
MTQGGLDLDARYGRRTGNPRRRLWISLAAGTVVVVLGVLWLVFFAFAGDGTRIQATDTSHSIVDDNTVSVEWQVTAPAGSEVSCALQAQNSDYAIVGWRIVDLPASEAPVRAFTEEITTSEPAMTGLIYRCWLS